MIDDFIRPERPKKPAHPHKQTSPATPNPLPASDEPAFRTPEEVAANEPDVAPAAPRSFEPPIEAQAKQKRRFVPEWHWPPTKKQLIIGAVVILVLGSGASAWLLTRPSPVKVVATPKKVIPKPKPVVPTTVASTLSGLPVDPSVNQRPVTGVMIENSLDARPQSGLSQASVVFEAIAEGGITRFLALYQDTQPTNVGPIRSSRPYYLRWALGFDAGYAHVGGSPEALQDIKDWGVRDLDQFYNGGSYHRVSNRVAPHNVYTGIPTLVQLEATKGYASSSFTGFARKKEAPSKQPAVTSIDLSVSSALYSAHYDYNASTNSYKRSEGGSPHIDAETSAQIAPKVVIALVMPYSLESDGYHSSYQNIGSGAAYIFQD
ncbi:MAG TPA: DUF3048 domain-containing protein, partial [Candidatus Saccharimonadales bacterium]|nr:DUF3048 domain-containing protein [Candidatus Saccharimonadales bacterium]